MKTITCADAAANSGGRIISYGITNILWGIQPTTLAAQDISNLPDGVLKVRIRQRRKCEVQAFLRYYKRTEQWILGRENGKVVLLTKVGENYKA